MRILMDTASTSQKKAAARGTARTAAARQTERIAFTGGRTGVDRECACAGIELSDQPEHASALLDALGVALLNRGCLEEGAQLVEKALRIRRKFFGDDHPFTALSFNSYARVLRERGELLAAQDTSLAALRINRAVFGGASLPVAVSLVELGVIYLNQARYADAESAAAEGFKILQKLGLDDTDPNASRLLDVRGRAEAARGAPEAQATLEAAVKLDRSQFGSQHPKFATHLANLASFKESQGQYRQAEALYLKTIDIYAKVLKRRCHPNLIDTYANLGSLYLARNAKPTDLKQAARHLQEALRLNLKVRGPAHVLVANDYANLGRLHYANGDQRAALRHFLTALQIYDKNVRRKKIAETFLFLGEVLNWGGRLLVESGSVSNAAKAEPSLERAVAIWAANGEPGEIGKAAAEAALGRALHLQDKDPARARELLTRAYGVLSSALGAEYPFVQTVRTWLDELSANSKAA